MYWEQKSMQTIRDADYMEALERFVRRAIDSGKGLDERDGDGRTALHWAAANGHQVCHTLCPERAGSLSPDQTNALGLTDGDTYKCNHAGTI